MFTDQIAYKVTVPLSVAVSFVTVAPSLYVAVVALLFSFQPRNVYPVFAYVFAVSFCDAVYLTPVRLAIAPLVEPFPLNAIVYVCSVHFAYTLVAFPAWSTVKFVPFNSVVLDIFVVHADSLYQPSSVYPVLVAVARSPIDVAYVTFFVAGVITILSSVAFPSNVTVYAFAVVVAVTVAADAGIVSVVSRLVSSATAYPVQPANVYPSANTALTVIVASYLAVYVPSVLTRLSPVAVTDVIPASFPTVNVYTFLV